MRKIIVFVIIVLILTFISAKCSENQVNINAADKNELIKIKYIGDSRAEQLISLRPFNSIDELVKIKGIGETYLQRIKEQGLACVDNQENTTETKITKKHKKKTNETQNSFQKENKTSLKKENLTKTSQIEVIKLNPQVIKTFNSEKNKEKENYALYGFIAFSFLIIALVAIKQYKDKKNELI